jgi:tetratricopeptide (TPR) repeat protein
LSIKFFSGEEGARRADQPARESQQAIVLRLLREADGAMVSYERLRDAGVELPASVVSELELAGIPIEHRYEGADGAPRRPGVRLNPALDPERQERDQTAASGSSQTARPRTGVGRRWTIPQELPIRLRAPFASAAGALRFPGSARRWSELRPATRALAPIALIGAVIVVIAVVVIALQTSHVSARHASRHHVSKAQARSAVVARTPQAPRPQPPPTPVSPALATQFEAQGHDLLQSGQYGDAVAVLRSALAATGMHLSDCLEPANETCLTYAYALYDLGRALELKGDPAAALPVLEQRLQIDNQRDVVAAELERVRASTQQ